MHICIHMHVYLCPMQMIYKYICICIYIYICVYDSKKFPLLELGKFLHTNL